MNKKLKRLCLFLVAPFLFCTACNNNEPSGGFTMRAKITAINSHIEVEILKDEYNSGIMWVNLSEKTSIKDENENDLSLNDLAVGDIIDIIYNGQVMLSYPGQISAQKIVRIKIN